MARHWPSWDAFPLCNLGLPPGWTPGLADPRYAEWSTLLAREPARASDAIVLHGLEADVLWRGPPLPARRRIAILFAETRRLADDAVARARGYDLVIAGSTWSRDALAAHGLPVALALQGVDLARFRPGPRGGRFDGRFVVFSGGKPELRKGQDLLLAAFARFARTHPDALLAAAWHSPHLAGAADFANSPYVAPVPAGADGRPDFAGWAAANGIAPAQFADLGPLSHTALAAALREVDVAVFPSRCESGTNLAAMECAAAGLPVFVSANTGHLDLIRLGAALPLAIQRTIVHVDGSDWGWRGSSVDEIAAKLAWAHAHRAALPALGRQAAAAMAPLAWPVRIAALASAIVGTADAQP